MRGREHTSFIEWFHMRSNILECVASTCRWAGICLSSTIRVTSLRWVLLYSSMTLFSIWTLPVGCWCCGGGFHHRISTDLLMRSQVTGIGSSPGMPSLPPTTTMQSCTAVAASMNLAMQARRGGGGVKRVGTLLIVPDTNCYDAGLSNRPAMHRCMGTNFAEECRHC